MARNGLLVVSVGRGVLIDVWSHLNKSYDPFTTYRSTLEDIKDRAEAQELPSSTVTS